MLDEIRPSEGASSPTTAGSLAVDAGGAQASSAPMRRVRTWPALLTLYLLSPIMAEMLSGSTPPLKWLDPFNPIIQPALYGSGVILARELVRRRGLGWGNLLMLGVAYSILEEGLAVQTWFNFRAAGSPSASTGLYGIAFGTSWVWALNLAVYHSVISITLPVVLVELLFPRIASRPWLGRKGLVAFASLLTLVTVALALLAGFVFLAKQGYTHPPLGPYLLAVALMVGCFWLGLRLRIPAPTASMRPAPRRWVVRLILFVTTLVFFLFDFLSPRLVPFAPAGALVSAGIAAFGLLRVRSWSARRGWDARYRLAVVVGVELFFLLFWAPLLEFLAHPAHPEAAGLTVANLVFMLGLGLFGWRLNRRIERARAESVA